jgi:hypothetical protein
MSLLLERDVPGTEAYKERHSKRMPISVPMNGETGVTNGPQSNLQSRRILGAIKKAFPNCQIIFNKGHYYCSCFVRFPFPFPEGKWVYMMTSDYRYFPESFIVRTAKDEKDYTGGVNNNYTGFENIISAIKKLGGHNG